MDGKVEWINRSSHLGWMERNAVALKQLSVFDVRMLLPRAGRPCHELAFHLLCWHFSGAEAQGVSAEQSPPCPLPSPGVPGEGNNAELFLYSPLLNRFGNRRLHGSAPQ